MPNELRQPWLPLSDLEGTRQMTSFMNYWKARFWCQNNTQGCCSIRVGSEPYTWDGKELLGSEFHSSGKLDYEEVREPPALVSRDRTRAQEVVGAATRESNGAVQEPS